MPDAFPASVRILARRLATAFVGREQEIGVDREPFMRVRGTVALQVPGGLGECVDVRWWVERDRPRWRATIEVGSNASGGETLRARVTSGIPQGEILLDGQGTPAQWHALSRLVTIAVSHLAGSILR